MPCGSLTAIMGASGSGKTSLLNSLSNTLRNRQLTTSGEILYNGNPDPLTVPSAYVMQDDVLLPDLTVAETLQYAARLRLPPSSDPRGQAAVVDKVIWELGLKDCMSTRIGNNARKGCSGGEKRRTSLGVRMLCNPSVLFLDEVTTGLDALSAFQLVRTLKDLAAKGRTIIVTIHQPRSEIWNLFDRLVLLSEGNLIYSGLASESILHFHRLGHTLPEYMNPAEFLIDLTTLDTQRPDRGSSSRIHAESLSSAWHAAVQTEKKAGMQQADLSLANVQPGEHPQTFKPGFWRSVTVQTSRTTKVTLRDPLGLTASLLEAILLGIIAGWIFLNLDNTLSGIRSREGALYCAAVLQGYLVLLQETYRLSSDVKIFDSERTEGVVGVWSFLISRRLSKLLLEDLIVPLIFSVIFYFVAGFELLAAQFFCFFAVVFLCHIVSLNFAAVCVAAFRDFARASLIANLSFTMQSICSE
ncbi:MAG: hypothetical protein Q9193_002020 [Seirophora villosa]